MVKIQRENKRAGIWYNRRGIDLKGNTNNFYEEELINIYGEEKNNIQS